MEILQTIWTALTTPNEELTNILILPLVFIEMTVCMLLYSTILNINTTKVQKLLYVISISIWTIFAQLTIPTTFLTIINMILFPLATMLIFKISFFKSIVSEIISFIVMAVLDPIFINIITFTFSITYIDIVSVPIYRIFYLSCIYISFYILYRLSDKFNINITLLDDMSSKAKKLLILNSILGIIAIFVQRYLSNYYNTDIPLFITTLSTISLLVYFCISMYSLIRTTKLEVTERNLEEAQLYNKSLKILHDNVRAFKHDFSNIVQAIGRICWN